MQSHHAIATMNSLQGMGIVAGHGVSLPVGFPCIAVTCHNSLFCLYTLINSQVQYYHTIATVDGLQTIIIYARLVVGLTCIIPIIAITSGLALNYLNALVDGQV